MFCQLVVNDTGIRVAGLKKRWPKKITSYLAPLDFKQQADNQLRELLGLFDPVQEISSQRQLVINSLTEYKLRQV